MNANLIDSLLQKASGQAAALNDKRLNPKTAGTLAKWIYAGAVLLALFWTLLWWGATWLVSLGDDAARAGTSLLGGQIQIPDWLVSSASSLQSIGESLLLILWIVGLVTIAILTAVGRWFLGAFTRRNDVTVLPRAS